MKRLNHFFIKEPCWRPVEQCRSFTIPMPVKAWLYEPGSLTQRIKQSFSGEFGVVVEGEGVAQAFHSDADVLNIPAHQLAFIREVTLTTDDQPRVFARTTVLLSSLKSLQKLTHLGTKPLGEVIFSYYDLQRIRLDIAKIPRSDLSPKAIALIGDSSFLWARRNTYLIAGHALIVCEFFVPDMFPDFLQQNFA